MRTGLTAAVACLVVVVLLVPAGASARPIPCPDNTGGDLYVNPDPLIKHIKKPHRNGSNLRPDCTFISITDALDFVGVHSLGAGTRIVLTGASPTAPARLNRELFPIDLPSGLTITTSDDPALGGAGLDPANYLIRFSATATHAMSLHGGDLRGVTFTNGRRGPAAAMAVCDAGTNSFDTVTLAGAGRLAATIATGLELSSACTANLTGVRVRDFGDGVAVDDDAQLNMDLSKVYENSGDGLALHDGATTVSNSEIAFNGDDGVMAYSPASADFVANDVRDNGGNGFEVHAVDTSFSSNEIHNNSRSTGWNEPQLLFSGEDAGDPTFGTEEECPAFLGGAPCFQFDFRGDTEVNCPNGVRNSIYSYDTSDTFDNGSVGLRAINNARVNAQNNEWQSAVASQNVTQGAGSFVAADQTCGSRGVDPDPPPPVG